MALILGVQLLLLNHIHLFGYATPVVLAYLTLTMRRGTSRVAMLLWGFCIGLLYDMASNTMGMAMATCTLLAMLQPVLLKLFAPADAPEDMRPTMRSMGARPYLLYALFTMLLFHIVFYALDAFTLSNWPVTLMAIGCSTVMAFLFVVIVQLLTNSIETSREQKHSRK
jgi:rod shape-determining protein MreD